VAYALAHGIGLSPLAAAFLALGAGMAATGALHEDGLADVADGFGGGRDRAAKLAILKDSRIGAYGVLALALSVGLRAALLAALAAPETVALALLATHALSRGPLGGLMWALPPARPGGLAGGLGRIAGRDAAQGTLLSLALALAFCLPLGFWPGVAAAVVALAAAATVGAVARRQIGGYTGDVLGAAQQAAEIAALLTLASLT
jgi:adenosylcobinamide-GDP ribazoletransferase